MATRIGTGNDDTLDGTSDADVFNMTQGGADTVNGLGGKDVFKFGATFDAFDVVNGGAGNDTHRKCLWPNRSRSRDRRWRDIGPAAFAKGGDLMLSAPLARSLSRGSPGRLVQRKA